MTCKELRQQQLEELKSGIPVLKYRVELLNSSFLPTSHKDYLTKQDAEIAYNEEIAKGRRPAFIRKYAVVPF